MGNKNELWCDMCARRIDFDAGIIAVSLVEVQGHAPIEERRYGYCQTCTDKLTAYLDAQKAAADTKWNRTDPKALEVIL